MVRVDLLADFFAFAVEALFPAFLLAAFLELVEPDPELERLRVLVVAISITFQLTGPSLKYLQKQRPSITEEALPVVDH